MLDTAIRALLLLILVIAIIQQVGGFDLRAALPASMSQPVQGHAFSVALDGVFPTHWWDAIIYQKKEDTNDDPRRSTLRVFEDGRELGRPHSVHQDIFDQGAGRYSHWGNTLIFASSDNTDPRTNGRSYTVRLPPRGTGILLSLLAFLIGLTIWRHRSADRHFMSEITLTVTACLTVFAYYLASEKINWGGGFGMDGQFYGAAASDPTAYVSPPLSCRGHACTVRILPSALVHVLLRAAGMEFSNQNIIWGFIAINALALWGSLALWVKIAKLASLSARATMLGACGLLVNFGTLKFFSYYPVLTDPVAQFIGFCAVYFFLTRSTVMLSILGAVSWFVWLTGPYFCLILVLTNPVNVATRRIRIKDDVWFVGRVICAGALVSLVLALALTATEPYKLSSGHIPYLALSAGTIFAAVWIILSAVPPLLPSRLTVFLVSALRSLPLATFILLMNHHISRPGSVSTIEGLQTFVYFSSQQPFVSLVSHVTFFGPIVLLMIMYFKDICRTASQFGMRAAVILICIAFMSLNSESRHLFMMYPFVIFFVSLWANHEAQMKREFLVLFVCVSLFMSKIWLTIGPLSAANQFHYPDVYFYMNLGPWMPSQFYWIHLGIALLAGYSLIKSACSNTASGPHWSLRLRNNWGRTRERLRSATAGGKP